jgi:hypothetical protein
MIRTRGPRSAPDWARHARAATLALLTAATAGAASPEDAALLKVKWTIGKRYLVHTEVNQDIEASDNASPGVATQRLTQAFDLALSVLTHSPEKGLELEVRYGRIAMTADADGHTLSFDTQTPADKDGDNPLAVLRVLADAAFRCRIDRAGNLTKFEGMDKFLARASRGHPAMVAIVNDLFSEKSLRQIFANALESDWVPKHPVRPSDCWEVEKEMPVGGLASFRSVAAYRFRGWESRDGADCAAIEFVGTMESQPTDATNAPVTVRARNGQFTGGVWFDTQLGAVREAFCTQDLTLLMTENEPAAKNPLAATTKTRIATRVRLLKVEDIAPAPTAQTP